MQTSNMVVEYIDHMGSDLSVVNSAKSSFGKADTEFKPKEHTRLINYLARGMTQADYDEMVKSIADCTNAEWVQEQMEQYRHTGSHFSPFCHATISIRLKAPIAIHAQFMKHTVGFSHNSTSRRYVSDTPDLFIPTFRAKPTGNIKQGSGDAIDVMYYACDGSFIEPTVEFMSANRQEVQDYITKSEKKLFLTSKAQDEFSKSYEVICRDAIETYDRFIALGISPEQARFVLPQGVMTEWVTTGSLYAWARLYNLRADHHAQKEIQTLAHMIGLIIEPLFPVSWQALVGHKD